MAKALSMDDTKLTFTKNKNVVLPYIRIGPIRVPQIGPSSDVHQKCVTKRSNFLQHRGPPSSGVAPRVPPKVPAQLGAGASVQPKVRPVGMMQSVHGQGVTRPYVRLVFDVDFVEVRFVVGDSTAQ